MNQHSGRWCARWTVTFAAAVLLTAVVPAAVGADGPAGPNTNGRTVDIQLLRYSDWHGAVTDAPVLGAYLNGC